MDHEKVRGYWVRIVKDRTLHQKLFSTGEYVDDKQALAAARAWRDNERIRLFGEHKDSLRRVFTSCSRNISGVIGVHYIEKTRRGGSISRAYVASWCPNKGEPQLHKYFSVARFGKRKAFKLAKQYREERVAEILAQK